MSDTERRDDEWAEHVRQAWVAQKQHPTATERLREMGHSCAFCEAGNDWHPHTLGGQMYELRLGFHCIGVTTVRAALGGRS